MDNTQLSKPLLGDVKSLEKAALLSMIADKDVKANQINPTTVNVNNDEVMPDPMKKALINISVVFNSLLPKEFRMPYRALSMVKFSDETHYLASTFEGVAICLDTKTKKIDEKKICDCLGYVAVLKGEQKAIFSGVTTLHEVKLPSLIPVKEKTFDFGVEIPKMVQSYDQNSIYVLLKEQKIVKVNPENFEEREDILEGNFTQMALSKTGEFATYSSDGKLALTNFQTSSKEELQLDIGEVNYLVFSNSQSKICAASEKTVAIVNVNPLEIIKILKMEEPVYSPVIATNENILILGNDNGKITFWDIKNKEILSEVQVHDKSVLLVKLSDDGKEILTNGLDGKFCTLNFPEFSKDVSAKVFDFESKNGSSLLIRPDDQGTFKKWDLATNKTEEVSSIEDVYIESYYVIDENNIIATNYEALIKYNLVTKEKIEIPLTDDNSDNIYASCISPDKKYYATGGTSQKVFLWDLKTMEKVKEFKGSDWYINCITFLPSSNVIAAGNLNGTVYFWGITTGEFIASPIKGEKDQEVVSLCAFNNEENVVIGFKNASILLYNWRAKALLATLKAGGCINRIIVVKDEKSMIVVTNEGKITFWNLITYNQLFHYDIKQEIVYFSLTADEKFLVYSIEKKKEKEERKEELKQDEKEESEGEEKEENDEEDEENEEVDNDSDNLFIKKNPLVTDVLVAEGAGSEFSYMKYVMDLINSKVKQHKPEFDKWVIMPYRINTLHLYSYYNHPNMLNLAIEAGGSLFNTNFGENALSFAIKKQFSGCVSAIVSSFGKLLKGNPNALNFISQDCIIGLNMLGYPSLTNFYKLIYTPYAGKFVKFVDESVPTPIYCHSKEIYPLESNFLQQEQKRSEGKPVRCLITSLPLPLANGSKASTDFLDSLEECPNSAIFTTKLIQDILDHKWETLKWAMYWQAIIYTIYMILLSVYILHFTGESLPLAIIFIFSMLLSSYEVFQFITSPSEYIEDVWNYIDGIRTILTVVYAVVNWVGDSNSDLKSDLLVALVIVSWMRGITYFRIFKTTRYMVNLITQVIKDITSFLILLFYSTLAFAFIFLVMDKNEPTLIDYIKISYRLDLGDFDSSGFTSTQWVCLFLATMINMIIMLNLLISIMGDTFGKVQENAEVADRKELLGMISEIETLMFWKKNITERSYFQVLAGEESEETEKNINTRVSEIKKNQKIFQQQNEKRLDSIDEMLKKIWNKLEGDKKEENDVEEEYSDESEDESGEESEEEEEY